MINKKFTRATIKALRTIYSFGPKKDQDKLELEIAEWQATKDAERTSSGTEQTDLAR